MSEREAHKTQKRALDLSEFEPKSMLQVHENIAFTITPNDKDLGELDAANPTMDAEFTGSLLLETVKE
jgi:hypothetical protein